MERGSYELAEALAINKFLLILNLKGNGISDEGLSYLLPAMTQSNTIVSLDLSACEITSGPIRQLVRKEKVRQGFTTRNVNESNFPSLQP